MKKSTNLIASSLLLSTILFNNHFAYAMDEDDFRGRIISSSHDPRAFSSGITGSHLVLYPNDEQGVKQAILRTGGKGPQVLIRSGTHFTQKDKEEGTDKVVINLVNLSGVTLNRRTVEIRAGTSTEKVFKKLGKQGFVIPLAANPLMSVVSNVLHEDENPSCLMRSLGPLSNCISQIRAVNPDGTAVVFRSVTRCKESQSTVTEVSFKPKIVQNLSMFCLNFLYPGQEDFRRIINALFTYNGLSRNTDLMLDTYNDRFGIPAIRVSAICEGAKRLEDLSKTLVGLIKQSLSPEVRSLIGDGETYSGSQVIDAISETEILCASSDPTIQSKKNFGLFTIATDLGSYVEGIHHAFSTSDTPKRTTRLQVNADNKLELTEFVYTPIVESADAAPSAAPSSRKRIYTATTESAEAAPSAAPASRKRARPASVAPDYFGLRESRGPIPNFSGPVFKPEDPGYKRRVKQYATSSCAKESMTPFMLAYPANEDEVAAAIIFAQTIGKKVVARSGGHQYTGKSSGDQGTIVLSMDNFKTLARLADGRIAVGPGIRLTALARQFKTWGVTIPHGECPFVAAGGHLQTGGYGHLIHSFGLALDYVQAFEIVLADGSRRTVTRPNPADFPTTDPEKNLNKDLFRGVLSGNAGSFGIVTKYFLNCIKDTDHPQSYGFTKARAYNKGTFRKLMKVTQQWTREIEARRDDTSLKGLDFMMTVESSTSILPPLMLVELLYSDPDTNVPYRGQLKPIIDTAKEDTSVFDALLLGMSSEGKKGLSDLSDSFVRRFPLTTDEGREFRYPYKKRTNVAMTALPDSFIQRFTEEIDSVVSHEPGVKLVFQMAFGGGAFRDKGKQMVGGTLFPHRDSVYTFVYDLFYQPGYEERAITLQNQMQGILDQHLYATSPEKRPFWGTFGNTNISDPTIRAMYYDSEDQYKKLQDLKRRIDPRDIFHTNLTVQLP